MKKTTNEPKPFKPAARELRLSAVAERLTLPEHAWRVYDAMVNVLAPSRVVHVDRIVDWYDGMAQDARGGRYEGAIVDWARMVQPILSTVVDVAIRVLVDEGLVTTETRMYQAPEGELYERTKVTLLPIEEWTKDEHFMAALAVRWPS